MNDLTMTLAASGSSDAQFILKKLLEHNSDFVGPSNNLELTITLNDSQGDLVAGLNGYTHWNWMYIKLLWTKEDRRGKGLGHQLMMAAEREALRRGAQHAWVDTFSIEARQFYEGLGYKVFGTLPEYPAGHSRYFLCKDLNGDHLGCTGTKS